MKKILLTVGIPLLIAAAGLTEWSSVMAQRAYAAWVNALASRPELALLETKYQSGWWVSTASTELEVRGDLGAVFQHALTAAGQDEVRARIGFHLEHRIQHGLLPLWDWLRGGRKGLPVLDRIDTRISFDQETQSELEPVVGRVPSLLAETRVRMGGESETALAIPAVSLAWIPLKSGGEPVWRLQWQGLGGGLVLGPNGRTLAGELKAPGFIFDRGMRRVMGVGLDLTVDWVRNAGGWWVGKTGLHARRLEDDRRAPLGPLLTSRLALHEMTASGASHVTDGRFAVRLDLLADRLTLGSHAGAPFHLQLGIRGDDSASVPAGETDAPEVPEPASADSWRSILKHRPVLDLSAFSIGTPAGAVEGQGRLQLAPVDAADTAAGGGPSADASPPGTRIAQATLDARFPAALVDDSLKDLPGGGSAPLVKQGLLVAGGGVYETRLELGATGVMANGKPLDPVTLAGIQRLADALARPAPDANAVAPAAATPAEAAASPPGPTPAAAAPAAGGKPAPAPAASGAAATPAAPPAAPAP